MTDTTCNGWSNYATWRINLEMLDGYEHSQTDTNDLAEEIQDFVESYLEETSKGLARDYALAFVSDVNWYEIAEHLLESEA